MAKVLWVVAHPDDEALMSGVAIAEHVAAGHDVHVLLLTRGTASGAKNVINGTGTSAWWGVQHSPVAEGYSPLSEADFGAARRAEFQVAVNSLAVGLGTVTVHEAGLGDNQVVQDDVEAAVVMVADAINPGNEVWLKGHSHIVDDNADHRIAGAAMRALAAADPGRFGNVRHYILPAYWTDARLSQVTEAWDTPANAGITARAVNACRAYAAWHPPHSYAIGMHSVVSMFTALLASPKCMYHL